MSHEHDIAGLIDSIADGRADRLAQTMVQRCWPGGHSDRSDPIARDWVSRWSPQAGAAPDVDISHN